MGVLDDLHNEIWHYGANNLDITVVNFNPPGSVINPGENCTFQIRAKNNGPLDMKNVVFHMNDLNGTCMLSQTQIAGNPYNFTTGTITTSPVSINAHSAYYSQNYFMGALKSTSGNQDLFEIHLSSWDASLHHALTDMSGHETSTKFIYNDRIHQD